MAKLVPIEVLPGVEPNTDKPETQTRHYTFTKGIRFKDGFPEKQGGYEKLTFDSEEAVFGKVRSIFSYILSGYARYFVGTHTRLYDVFGSVLTNVTPLKTTTTAIANSLDTYYATLGSNPVATTSGSMVITITDAGHKFAEGQTVTLSGSSAVNGIPSGDINTDHYIRSVTANTYSVIVSTAASSSGSGGGASIVRTSGHITVNATGHGLSDGDRIKLQAASDTGGISASLINIEHIISNVVTNSFDIYTTGTATSSVSGGGGASTTYQEPIEAGQSNTLQGQGYGVGLYGVGLYGVSKTSTATNPARLWSHDRFGDLTVSTYNDQSDIYSWDGNTAQAPAKVTNSYPSNYVFVSDNILVSLGYDPVDAAEKGNAIAWTDQGGITNWSTGQAGSDVIEGAGKFLSHASARGENLLFTNSQTYTFRYIGGQFIWQTKILDPAVGIIAQNARCTASGVVYWMANNNFYMWRGGKIEVIPSNSSSESTCLRYVFDNINYSQKEKVCCFYNEQFREVWWAYPSLSSEENDRLVVLNIDTFEWWVDDLARTAFEYPAVISQTPYMSDTSSVIYLHENGDNANGSGLDWQIDTGFIYGGTDTIEHAAFIPNASQTGSINVNIKTKLYPYSANIVSKDYTVTPTNDRVPTEINGRYIKYSLSGSALNQKFMSGQWYHELKKSSEK